MAEYSYVTNDRNIYEFLLKNTRRTVFFMESGFPYDKADVISQKMAAGNLVYVMYEDRKQAAHNKEELDRVKAKARYYSSSEWMDDHAGISSVNEYIKKLKKDLPVIEHNLMNSGDEAFVFGFNFRCGNCHKPMKYEDKYCSYCGTRRGEGAFDPFDGGNAHVILYGSPDIVRYRCSKCGKTWIQATFEKEDVSYCSICGNRGEEIKRKWSDIVEEMYRVDLGIPVDEWLDMDKPLYTVEAGTVYCTYYDGKCGNCHGDLDDDAKYCMYCGTKRGDGDFRPYSNVMSMVGVYGSPMISRYRCPKCNRVWYANSFGENRNGYCKECGSQANIFQFDEKCN